MARILSTKISALLPPSEIFNGESQCATWHQQMEFCLISFTDIFSVFRGIFFPRSRADIFILLIQFKINFEFVRQEK